jgi:hypothetical protein
MAVKEFDEFVTRQLAGLDEWDQVDWERARKEWLKHLGVLYERIEVLLSRYTESHKIRIRTTPVDLNDEAVGAYVANKMILRIGRQEVILVPSGSLFLDFKGLVKVIGSAADAALVLAEKDRRSTLPFYTGPQTGQRTDLLANDSSAARNIEWAWKILPRPPSRQLFDLTEENFFQLIMEVSNG